jgi:hypothetical protein
MTRSFYANNLTKKPKPTVHHTNNGRGLPPHPLLANFTGGGRAPIEILDSAERGKQAVYRIHKLSIVSHFHFYISQDSVPCSQSLPSLQTSIAAFDERLNIAAFDDRSRKIRKTLQKNIKNGDGTHTGLYGRLLGVISPQMTTMIQDGLDDEDIDTPAAIEDLKAMSQLLIKAKERQP